MAECIGLPQQTEVSITEHLRYHNRIKQLKKERELGKHYGSNKVVGKLSRKK